MGHYVGPKCRLCRRIGEKLFLKGEKCNTNCALDEKTRQKPPGQHGELRQRKPSVYKVRFLEKQKLRHIIGSSERQFRRLFAKAEKMKGITGENLLRFLELRLDNVIYRLGFGSSRAQARQFILHEHIKVNERKVNIPSYLLRPGDRIELRPKLQDNIFIQRALEESAKRTLPSWLSYEPEKFTAKILKFPEREEISYPINEQLIVELYSR